MQDKNIFIKSAMGTGKSTLIRQWIKNIWNDKKILYISM
jgi:tRNA A37 threonylcarbamoyladenosine biosynthesis protein TsaE